MKPRPRWLRQPPTALSATGGSNQVSLSWTAPAGTILSDNVKRATVTGGPYTTISTAGAVTGTSYTDSTAANGTTYYYVVSAVGAGGEGANSAEASVTPQVPAPAVPTGLSATGGSGQVSLSWTASAGATSYNLYRGTTPGGEGTTPFQTGLTGTTFTDNTVTASSLYSYQVSAVNAQGESPFSAETPRVGPTAPVTLSSITVSPTWVQGGRMATGTITLSGPAPASGLSVSLSSDNAAATVPALVTVASGTTSATFSITTTAVSTNTTCTILVVASDAPLFTPLTVTASAPPPAHWVVSYQSQGQCLGSPTPSRGSPWPWPAGSTGELAYPNYSNPIYSGNDPNTYTCDSTGWVAPVLTWTPGYSGDTTPAPSSAAILVTSKAEAGSYDSSGFSNGGTWEVDDGFEDTATYDYNRYWISQGTHLFQMDNPNHSLTLTFPQVTMNAEVTMPGNATQPGYSGDIESSCTLTAAPISLTLNSSGMTSPQYVLTGQQVQASLNVPSGFTVDASTYQWSSTGDVFRTYNENATSHQLVLLSDDPSYTNQPTFTLFDKSAETITITCNATLVAPDGTRLPVTVVSPQITVLKPSVTHWGVAQGYVQFNPNHAHTGYQAYGLYGDLSSQNNSDGMIWSNVTVSVPTPFSGGQCTFTQLINPDRLGYIGNSSTPLVSNNGILGLDGNFMYGPPGT